MTDIGKLFDINKLYEDFGLPYWKDAGIVRSEVENLPTQQKVKQYLRRKKYPVIPFLKALMRIKQTRQPKPSTDYYRITVPIMVDILFHEKEGYVFEGVKKTEEPKKATIRPVRNGMEWLRVKTKSAPLFKPCEKYKSVDEFASFATNEEIQELWSK